jgi:alkylation response protein AidB-like acyl-CoA dehydrogenase
MIRRLDTGPGPPNDPLMTCSAETLLDAARALVPTLAAREAETSANRRVPDDTIARYHRAGILRAMQPRRFGGHQASFGVFSRIVEILAEGCTASAWVYAVLGEHQWILACMPEQAQVDVWGGEGTAVASSSLAPRETARSVPGGWRLSGRFPFSSGCLNAQWAILGAKCEGGTRYLLVPLTQAEIVDDWEVLGLRGTGSRTLVLEDVFIPAHRSVLLKDLYDGTTPGSAVHPDYPLLRAPRGLLVPFSLPGVGFTVGRRALAMAAEALRTRVSRGTVALSQSEVVQQQLGLAAAEIETAVVIMEARRAETLGLVDSGAPLPPSMVARNRRDIALAIWQVRAGVERLVELSGARTVYDADPMQALWRDIMTISTHAVVSRNQGTVPYGRMLMGLPPSAGEA